MPPPVAVPQNAIIDIMEPLTIGSGQRQDVTFRYLTGIPAATAFGMEWYANEVDPALNRPPLTTRDMPIPTQTFSPAEPQPNTGDFQDGTVSIQAPDIGDDADGLERFYGNNFYLPSLRRIHMTWVNQTAFLFICLLLLGCLSCGDPPPSVMELVMPDTGDTTEPPPEMTTATKEEATEPAAEPEPVTDIEPPTEVAERDVIPPPTSVDTSLLDDMQAILSVDGEVHSPIPDDVYDLLWGHYTKAGSAAPRDYYTKYIDAEGIAIVGGDLTEEKLLQAARHIVLIMTSKLPGLREALSIDTPGPDNLRFRLVVYDAFAYDAADITELQTQQGAAFLGGHYIFPRAVAPMRSIKFGPDGRVLVHEMAHAVHGALVQHPHLFPDFDRRLHNEYERQQEHFRLRDEEGLTDFNGEKYPTCGGRNAVNYIDYAEYWAVFVDNWWFDELHAPWSTDERRIEGFRNRCGDVVNLAEEIFPPFSITEMMPVKYW